MTGVLADQKDLRVADLVDTVIEQHGDIPRATIVNTVGDLIKTKKAMGYRGQAGQEEKPDQLYYGTNAVLFLPDEEDVICTPAQATVKGWMSGEKEGFKLSGPHGARVVVPLLRRIGTLYNRGATSTLDLLDIIELKLPNGGRLRLSVEEVGPASLRDLAELFEVLAGVAEQDGRTTVDLEIADVDDSCVFLQELRKGH